MEQVVKHGSIDKVYSNPNPFVRCSVDKDAFRAYSYGEDAMMKEFRTDLEKEYGFVVHPKADLLWSKAWERGHANGFQEVAHAYEDLAELIG